MYCKYFCCLFFLISCTCYFCHFCLKKSYIEAVLILLLYLIFILSPIVLSLCVVISKNVSINFLIYIFLNRSFLCLGHQSLCCIGSTGNGNSHAVSIIHKGFNVFLMIFIVEHSLIQNIPH